MNDATQQGASVQDRLEAFLEASEAPIEEPKAEEPEEVNEAEEVEAEDLPEAEEDGEGEEVSEDAEDEEAEPSVELDALAEYLGIDVDKLDIDEDGRIAVKTKIDGEEGRAKLADLVKSYQLEGHLNKQNMEVAEQRKALEAQRAEFQTQKQAELQQLQDLSQLAYSQLVAEYQAISWNELRSVDPAEWSAKQQEFQQRNQQIQQAFAQIQGERSQLQTQQQERFKEVLAEEGKKLMQAIPEWADESVAQKERNELRTYLKSNYNFSDDEVNQIADHRHVLLIRDAMKYRALQAKKPEIEKKVKKAPKLVKPGQSKDAREREQNSLKKLKQTVKKSGGKGGSVAEYLLKAGKV